MSNAVRKIEGSANEIIDAPERIADQLADIAGNVLKHARAGGADAVEVSLSNRLGRQVSVRLDEIDTLEEARDRGISVTVYRNRASGTASSADFSPEALERTVDHALAIARHTQPDPAGGLADPDRMAREIKNFDVWYPEDVDMDALLERARAMERAGLGADPRVANSEGAAVTFEASIGVYANSHGFVGHGRQTGWSQSCILVGRDDSGMQRDWDWDEQCRRDRLNAPETTGRKAAERVLRRLGARRAPSGKFPVLYVPDVAHGLIRHLSAAASGSSLYRRSSFLLDAAGEKLFPDWVSIVENPHLKGSSRSSSFDDEGVATRIAPLIEDGVLARYILASYSARKLGMESTGNAGGVRNLLFQPGEEDFDALVKRMGRGLIVTEVMGQGVNLVTGDYSRGASGFWVEDGEIVWPVEEITVAGNLRQMYADLIAAGSDIETRRNIQVPSLLLGSMTVAGEE